MAEATMITTISRRSTRVFDGEQDITEAGAAGNAEREARQCAEELERLQKTQKPQKKVAPTITLEVPTILPQVDYGRTLSSIFSSTAEHVSEATQNLLAAKESDKGRGEGRPINFGIVLPKKVFRSSFPMTEDFQYLQTLNLKTIISLVKKDFASDFKIFMKEHGIRHVVIDMQGTKKVDIPDAVMHSIMEVALNEANHPLLIHCNHGKHRTGCAVGVMRHVAGWNVADVVKEYQGFAEPKVRDCDISYITEYQASRLTGLFNVRPRNRGPVLTSPKMAKFLMGTAAVLLFMITSRTSWVPNY